MNMKESIKQICASLEPGQSALFPISRLNSVRNAVTTLNMVKYLEGMRWRSETAREEGNIRVWREK